MEKIRLGRTGMMVSNLGFGGIPIQRLTENEAIDVIQRALDLGVNFIDTANGYTTSEERIGKAIRGRREGLFLATKTLDRTGDGVKEHLKLSLQRFGVDYIDLYQFHNVNNDATLTAILAPGGPMSVLEEAKKAGVVRHIGISSHQIDMAKDLVKTDRFETLMFPFNFITCEPAEELLPLARQHDVGFIAMKPLAGGMLENASLAFKYLLQFPDIVPIPGIEIRAEIEEIAGFMASPQGLTEAEQAEIARLRQELGTTFCRRCDYCQPCSEKIAISLVIQAESLFKRLSLESVFSRHMGPELEKAADCIRCGDCEARCPYGLPIMDMIEESYNIVLAEKKKYQAELASQ
jgi:predicted aldo/keto reductase-like oxidoreductase